MLRWKAKTAMPVKKKKKVKRQILLFFSSKSKSDWGERERERKREKERERRKQKEKMLRPLTFKCKIEKIMLDMSLTYTPVTQSIIRWIFLMCVAIMHCL